MKRTLSVLLLAGSAFVSTTAYAAPVFLLQFGSFESRAEADEKLTALKTKHAGVLSRMEVGVREVTLPPDNLTVYRTQAGPLATRADAQSVCSQLASNGDDCYVVETAMMQPMSPPTQQVAQTAPAPAPTPMPVATPAMPAVTPVPAPMPMAVAPMPEPSLANRDPQNIAAMNRVSPGPAMAPTITPMQMQPDPQADAMHRELAQAAEQNPAELNPQPSPFAASSVGVSPATTSAQLTGEEEGAAPAPAPKKDRSLWDRIFGSDEPEPKQKAAAPAPATPIAAPVEPVLSTNVPPLPVLSANAASVAATAPMQTAPAAPLPEPTPMMAAAAPQPIVTSPVITQAEPFPLPPPPAPLSGMSRPAPATSAMTVAPPMPIAQQTNLPSPVLAANANGNVRVEEAKRVPLSESNTPAMPLMAPPATGMMPSLTPAAPATLPPQLSPSATIGQKTLWAQIGSFPDQQAALAFWDTYRRSHPDFPVVRVRVTSPLMAAQRGIPQLNLRVGPFARSGFIQNLCASMVQEGLKCGTITDMGVASGPQRSRGMLPQSRYAR